MSIRILKIIYILLITCFLCIFWACNKQEAKSDIVGIAVVKYASDTTRVVKDAKVVFSKYDVRVEGETNAFGECVKYFEHEAILDITATIDTSKYTDNPPLTGNSIIRLQKGKTVRKTVYLY